MCRYPTFGKECQSLCICNIQNCDHANGCIQPTTSKFPQQLSIKCTIYCWSSYLFYHIRNKVDQYKYLDGKIHFVSYLQMSFATENKIQFTIHKISITTTKRLLEMDNVSSNKGKKGGFFFYINKKLINFTMYLYCVCLYTLRFVEKNIVQNLSAFLIINLRPNIQS